MFTVETVRKFHGWTHASLDILLDHLATIPASDYQRKLSGYSFATLRDHVIHILNCEGVWIQSLQKMPYVDRNADDCPAVADARLMKQEMKGRTEAYLSGLTDEQLNADTELRFPDGALMVRTPALILHHVLTHAFHHKGLMVAMCRELGYPAPDTHLCRFQ